MKLGKVFLLMLVLLLALFVCASCDDDSDESLNVASDQIVTDVVKTTRNRLGEVSVYVVDLIGLGNSPDNIANVLTGTDDNSFINTNNGDTISVTENSLVYTRTWDGAKYDVSITDLASSKTNYVPIFPAGSFSITRYEGEGVKAFTCSGTFKLDDTYYAEKDNSHNWYHVDLTEVVFDAITYDGTKYDVKKFNEALEDALPYYNIIEMD